MEGALVREIEACRACPLGATRQHPAIYRGGPAPWVVFVGEAPGADEDRHGIPFVGRSGRRLDAAIEAAGLRPDEVGILNLIKCRPPENRFPPASAIACRPFLDRQLDRLRPRLLVPLGARPLRAFDPDGPSITASAGVVRGVGRYRILPLLHPAAALHNPNLRGRWEHDIGRLRDEVRRLRAEIS